MRKLIILALGAVILVMALAACGGGGGRINHIINPPSNSHDVAGTLTDPYGNPVPDASLLVDGNDSGIKTDSEGNFTIPSGMVAEGRAMRIGVRNQGVMMGETDFVPEAPWRFDWQLGEPDPNGGTVNGLVTDSVDETPVTDAMLVLFNEAWVSIMGTNTDGTFEFTGVPAGDYQVLVFAPNYRLQMKSLTVESGNTTQLNIALEAMSDTQPSDGYTVKGRIVDAVSGNGVAGALVQGNSDNGWYYLCDTTTDPSTGGGGTEEPRGVLQEDDSSDPTDVIGSEPMPPVDGNGPTNWEEPVYQETYTDENGYYEFTDPFNGMGIYVNATQDDYMPTSGYFAREADGEVEANLEMNPIIPVNISGTVTSTEGGAVENAYVEFIYIDPNFYGRDYAVPGAADLGNMDAGGMAWASTGETDAALPGAAPPPSGESFDQSLDSYGMASYRNQMRERRGASQDAPMPFGYYATSTDANGDYSLEGIPAGYYSVFVSAHGFLSYGGEMEITADSDTMDFALNPVPVGTVTGRVTDDTGEPIPDALVNATQPYVDPFTFTDADGYFELSNVPAGTWRVGAYKEGFSARAVTVEISEDVVIDLDFTLPADSTPPPTDLVTLTGRVLDGSTNEVLANADIVAVATDDSYHSYVTSDANGNYTLQLPAGTYNVLVQVPEYADVYIQVWVDPEWPSFDFYMWPFDMRGGWGTIVNGNVPPPTEPPSGPPPEGI
jgi:hypothetical protein